MTRINTNVPSLVAQNRLQASNEDLNTALTRLSTGLRINSGADDPAGLIASEALRSEITSLGKAITNTNRASQIISTADSSLGEVSNLLNDIRGLVVEAANSGALSDDEIAANQLQVDSSLEAINRIAQTTTFQGRKLLDGSLGFQTTAGTGFDSVANLQIDQANLGTTGAVSVDVNITAAAQQATLSIGNIPTAADGDIATADLTFSETTPAVASTVDISIDPASTGAAAFTLAADTAGAAGDGFTVNFVSADATTNPVDVAFNGTDTFTVTIDADSATPITAEDVADAFNAQAGTGFDDFTLSTSTAAVDVTGGTDGTTDGTGATGDTIAGVDEVIETATLNITADNPGLANSINNIVVNEVAGTATPTAAFADGVLTVTTNDSGTVALADIAAAIGTGTDFTAALEAGGTLTTDFDPAATAGAGANFVPGTDGGLTEDIVFELQGSEGSEVFNVSAGTTIEDLISQINLVSDATGVSAVANGTSLDLTSSTFGSDSIVDLRVISEADGGTFGNAIDAGIRTEGSDIQARVNGIEASGRGNRLSINTATLDLSITVDDGSNTDFNFSIGGGGALFQLGADVVGNQQARIGIDSVNTARLGGPAGNLFQLGSGESAALASDPNLAAKIVTEAIDQVTGLRGRLGAFQATTLNSNLVSLGETQANLLEAESSIRDADFAQESANLTRAQILVQSGTNVLSLANQNPQNVLSLLG